MVNSDLAQRIKSIRTRLNLSQDRFAKKIGLTGKTISAYENGRCVPPLKVLDKITTTYGQPFLSAGEEDKDNLTHKLSLIKQYLCDLERILS